MTDNLFNPLLAEEIPEQAAEYLRLAVSMMQQHQLTATPINYALFYTYVSGKHVTLNNKIDKHLQENTFTHDTALQLFTREFMQCGDTILENLRNELMDTVTEAIGSLMNVAGKTSSTNRNLELHIASLNDCKSTKDIVSSVSCIITETKSVISESQQLEHELITSSKGLKDLKSELANARIEASTDALTGLNNRRGFDEQLKKMLNDRRRTGQGFSLIMADMDHFKKINDSYGHLVGDKVLKAFSALLQGKTRESDFVARYGGEEFVIILPNTSLDNAYFVAENIRKSVEKLRVKQAKTGDVIGSITSSFGVATHRIDETGHELLDRCDQALYKAKHAGRNNSKKAE